MKNWKNITKRLEYYICKTVILYIEYSFLGKKNSDVKQNKKMLVAD